MTKPNEIGRRLRRWGEKHYGSMSAFAAALAMRPQTLNNYLAGQMNPGNKLQAKLRTLGCNIEELMTGKIQKEETIGENEKLMLAMLQESNIRSPDELRKRLEDIEKLLRTLGPAAFATLVEGALAMERQAVQRRLKKRKT